MTHADAKYIIAEIDKTGYRPTPWENIVIGMIEQAMERGDVLTPAEGRRLSRVYTHAQNWADRQMMREL